MVFLPGFHAFPGGQREESDASVPVRNCEEPEAASMIACAARELFEELGVLVARGAAALTKGQLASVTDDVESGRMSFGEMLAHYGLELDARDFTFVGRWVTPPFSPRRFDTWFFVVECPAKQEPAILSGEFDQGEWISANAAYRKWLDSQVLSVPPVIHAVRTLSGGMGEDLVDRFLSVPQAHRQPVRRIEFRPNFVCFPVRTPTKPPATHTNCYLVGSSEFIVIDPAPPYEDEQTALAETVDDYLRQGRKLRKIILTHVHPDHVGGVNALVNHLNGDVQVAAHRLTAEGLGNSIKVDRFIEDGEVIELDGDPPLRLVAMHTPGHARGHLCFYHEATGALITGDNIVGLGSVLIDPPEGNMRDYLASLDRMAALPHLTVLFGAHGAAMGNPIEKINEYRQHRLDRESAILSSIRQSALTPAQIVEVVYTDVNPKAYSMAERAVLAHLEKLIEDNLVSITPDGGFTANDTNPRSENDLEAS